ncbi:hypothetical protein QYE76_038654 [Lolium multiflorum]|uniref:Uncharacterized protein n=1 Tax=Lolium multiflorum TaxID=4521 RepID=A0AAD8WT29_LOLMU|nr:hypothetical protein QYE76_038654 [Lolium multiflorum]
MALSPTPAMPIGDGNGALLCSSSDHAPRLPSTRSLLPVPVAPAALVEVERVAEVSGEDRAGRGGGYQSGSGPLAAQQARDLQLISMNVLRFACVGNLCATLHAVGCCS